MHPLAAIGAVIGIIGGILGIIAFVRGEIRSSREHKWRTEEAARRRWERDTLAWGEKIRRALIGLGSAVFQLETDEDVERGRFLAECGRARFVLLGDASGDALIFDDVAEQIRKDPCPR